MIPSWEQSASSMIWRSLPPTMHINSTDLFWCKYFLLTVISIMEYHHSMNGQVGKLESGLHVENKRYFSTYIELLKKNRLTVLVSIDKSDVGVECGQDELFQCIMSCGVTASLKPYLCQVFALMPLSSYYCTFLTFWQHRSSCVLYHQQSKLSCRYTWLPSFA